MLPFSRRNPARLVSLVGVAVLAVGLLLPMQSASALVTSSISNTAPNSDINGYAWVNYFRGLAGLGGVARNVTMEAQGAAHVRYLANHSLACETNVHDELTIRVGACGANPYATGGGKAAANNSNITRVSGLMPDRSAVASWFVSGFHALTLLDPRLASTGYSAYYTANPLGAGPMAWKYTAAVDVYRGRSGRYSGATVAFPANNAASPLLSYAVGSESPEPFRSAAATSPCRGWGSRTVVSAPVIVQWPLAARPASAYGQIVDMSTGRWQGTCSLNTASYPVGSLARQFLGGANGITQTGMYFAATPFIAGHRYQLRLLGHPVTTFTATVLPSAPVVVAVPLFKAFHAIWTPARAGVGSTGGAHKRLTREEFV